MARRKSRIIYRRPQSAHWYYDFTVAGRRVRRSCETDDEALAEIIAAKARSDTLLRGLTGAKPTATLDAAFGRYWLEHACRLPSAATIAIQSANILRIMAKDTPLDEFADADVAAFVARRRAKVSDATVNREMTILRAVLNMARDRWGLEVAKLAWPAHRLREPAGRTRYLSADEAERLIAAAAPHLKPAIALSLHTGIRLANCVGLDWAMVDMPGRVMTLRVKSRTPGGKVHTVALNEDAFVALANMGPRDHGRVFTWHGRPVAKWRRAFATACRRANIAGFHWHDLRHTAASWMVQRGVPLDTVRSVLGHARIETTMRYAHREVTAERAAVDAIAAHLRHSPTAAPAQATERKRFSGK